MPKPRFIIEALEQRIAPASLTFLDIDGDQVTVTTSKGTKQQLKDAMVGFEEEGLPFQLSLLDLTTHSVFKGTNLTISVVQDATTGDGFVSVGNIHASGLDLGRVTVAGDVSQIDAGDRNLRTAGLKSLEARGLGTNPLAQNEGSDLRSSIIGDLPAVKLAGNLAGTLAINGKLGTMEVQNLVGGELEDSGSIITAKGITSLKVQNLQGGLGFESGTVKSDGVISRVEVLGSLVGGEGERSGSIGSSKNIGTVTVAASVSGGGGLQSGSILAGQDIGSVEIRESLQGGAGKQSGSVLGRDLRSVVVGGAVIGGAGNVDGVGAEESGRIFASRNLFYAEVGSLQGGSANFSGAIGAESNVTQVIVHQDVLGNSGRESGVIGAGKLLNSVTVEGDVIGGTGAQSGGILSAGRIATVLVQGALTGSEGEQSGVIATNGGITKVTVGSLVGGTGRQSGAIGSTLSLGSVTVLGNIVGSTQMGSGDDAQIVSGGTIGSITVQGSILGGASYQSGSIISLGAISTITVNGALTGGTGDTSGYIAALDASIGTLTLGGITGGQGVFGAQVNANSISKVTLNGDLQGGAGGYTARVMAERIGSVDIKGSLRGNPGDNTSDGFSGALIEAKYLGAVNIDGDLEGGSGTDSGIISATYNQPSITIGGSLIGGYGARSGAIYGGFVGGEEAPYYTTIRSITIKGSIQGGVGFDSGVIDVTGTIAQLTVGSSSSTQMGNGSIIGGAGNQSGAVRATKLGTVTLTGSLQGGSNFESGQIMGFESIGSVNIGRSLIGGAGDFNGSNMGQISSHGRIGAVTIGFDIIGGTEEYGGSIVGESIGTVRIGFSGSEDSLTNGGITAGPLLGSGAIIANFGDIDRIEVGGAIYGGAQGGQLLIAAQRNIGTIKAGEIIGDAPHAVLITAGGEAGRVAIANVLVSGSMNNTDIIAGYDNTQSFGLGLNPSDLVNAHTQIGTIDVGASGVDGEPVWLNNNIAAGVFPGMFGNYGDVGETNFESIHSGPAYSRIAKIIIRGPIGAGDPDYTFGFAAEIIGSVVVDGTAIDLTPGALNDTVLIGTDSRTYINEQVLGGEV